MIQKPMDVLNLHPIRKGKKRKAAFRRDVTAYAQSLGFEVREEKGSFGATNVVIGDSATAKYLVTAHYDTCAGMFFPNFITPCNPIVYLVYQFFIVILFLVLAVFSGVFIGLGTGNIDFGATMSGVVYWILLFLLILGPANRNNANDNTSGVVTVLEIARSLPEEFRSQVCFVLFDLEEAGLIGSSAYHKKHKKESKNQLVLNMDCVGDGDEIVFFPCKRIKKQAPLMQQLSEAEGKQGSKSIAIHRKGFSMYPSDQAHFRLGVGIAAFHRKPLLGLYCSRIHTWRDTVLEEENVAMLKDAVLNIVQNP